MINNIFKNNIFQIGLFIKFILIIILYPKIHNDWFIPFLTNSFTYPISIPWENFIKKQGDILSYPYGPIMYLFNFPFTFSGWTLDKILDTKYFINIGFKCSLLFADFLLLISLINIFEKHHKKVLIFYWLSPIAIFLTFWHGQIDIIPISIFIFGLLQIKKKNFLTASFIIALSIMCKHSMLIVLPFIFIYLYKVRVSFDILKKFIFILLLSILFFEAPLFINESFQIMVLQNREIEKIYWMTLEIGSGNIVYLTILIYILLIYFFYRIRRVNFDLFFSVMGIAFSIIILMTPTSPGWFFWIIPALTLHQIRYGNKAYLMVSFFSIIFIFYHFLYSSGSSIIFLKNYYNEFNLITNSKIKFVHHTFIYCSALLIIIQILRNGIRSNDYFQIGQRPISIGIAGDSGSGKSTLSTSLARLFGDLSTSQINGDDYHNWERGSSMWKVQTHLDPKSNNLFEMTKDIRNVLKGNAVFSKIYDHSTGKFLSPRIKKSSDVVIINGLHALYLKQIRSELDVKIYLDMDIDLQTAIKIHRDTKVRNQTKEIINKSILGRKKDLNLFIKPQSEKADIIFQLIPINKNHLEGKIEEINLKIFAQIKNGIYYNELVKVLIEVCCLEVNINSVNPNGEVILEISGNITSEDTENALSILLPNMEELLGFSNNFDSGTLGIMQIITLMEMDESLKKRNTNN